LVRCTEGKKEGTREKKPTHLYMHSRMSE